MASDFNVRISASIDLTQARAQMEQFRQQYQSLVINGGASGASGSSRRTSTTVGGLSGTAEGIQRVGNSARSSTTMVGSFARELGNLRNTIPKVAAFSVATAAISAFTTGIKDAVGAVVEMDKQLTEFKKVSSLSGQGLDEFAKKASKMGTDVARTGSQMVEAATEFRKSGFGDYDSLELAHVASMFQNIADSEMSAGDAAGFIVSQMKAFNITASNATHIIDAVNETSNNFAVSSTDIATGLSKTSSAMAVLGNSYEETIALLVSGTEILSGQASKVARGLRTVGNNISSVANDTGKLEYSVGGTAKSVSLLDEATGDMISTFDALGAIAEDWDDMSLAEQQAIGIALAGKLIFALYRFN